MLRKATRRSAKQPILLGRACRSLSLEPLESRLLMARNFYVDANAPGLSPDGSSWALAYQDLQQALAQATSGDRILVADGTYKPTTTTDRSKSFVLKSGVQLLGGYAGYAAPDSDARDIAIYPSILSGNIDSPTVNYDNSYHVLTASGAAITSSTILDGFTITAGSATDYGSSSGGGMYVSSSAAPAIRNCTFNANFSTHGGGVANESSSPTFDNCTFIANFGDDGGAIYNWASSPTFTNCTFTANTTDNRGGGIDNGFSSSPTLSNCVFHANSADDGGGIYNYYASATLTNCTFTANYAYWDGGGMTSISSSPVLTHCTFTANSSSRCGGIHNLSGSPKLTNCILWVNTATSGSQIEGSPVITYSDIQGGFSGAGNINADPQFVRNPSPGLDGKWGTSDDDYGDLRLTSPAIDAVYNAATTLTTDLAGNSRLSDIPTVPNTGLGTSPLIDLGAYEAQRLTLSLPTTSGPDTLHLRLSPDGLILDFFPTFPATGSPVFSQPLDYLTSLNLGSFSPSDSLLLSNATLPQLESWLKTKRLTSSSQSQYTTLAAFPQPDDSILVKLAWHGDVNADGGVNLNDYFTIDSHYLNQSPGIALSFHQGDVNLDGAIDLNYYFLIDSAYLAQGAPLSVSMAMTTGQETTTIQKAAKKVFSAKKLRKSAVRRAKHRTRAKV